MKARTTKFLNKDQVDGDPDIYDDVNEKKALPELILKANILQAQDNLLLSEREMMTNYRISNRFLKEDRINFEGNLVLLWSFIRQMVEDQKIEKEDHKYYEILLALEIGQNNIRIIDLIYTKNFLMKCLHRINITNLFQAKGKGYKEVIANL